MTPERIKFLHRICGIATTVLLIILAIALIVSCVGIKLTGEKPFTAENVGQHLKNLAVPGVLLLISVTAGIVLQGFFPLNEGKVKTIRDKKVKKPKELSPAHLGWIRTAVLVLALALIIAGIFNEGWSDVLNKAIRICQECIGMG